MNFLRTKLRNFDIDIQTRIDEIVHTKKPYTVVEKYHYMAQKNPFLAELRNRFNLDIDA
jgi:DNA polymerase-3 subunit gamma/tau